MPPCGPRDVARHFVKFAFPKATFLPSHTNPSRRNLYTVHAKSVCSPHWHEIFLNDTAADTGSVAESVATGHSILVLDSVSSASECESLAAEASQAATKEREAKERAALDDALALCADFSSGRFVFSLPLQKSKE